MGNVAARREVCTRFTEGEEGLRKMFSQIDTDGSGTLDRHEAENFLHEVGAEVVGVDALAFQRFVDQLFGAENAVTFEDFKKFVSSNTKDIVSVSYHLTQKEEDLYHKMLGKFQEVAAGDDGLNLADAKEFLKAVRPLNQEVYAASKKVTDKAFLEKYIREREQVFLLHVFPSGKGKLYWDDFMMSRELLVGSLDRSLASKRTAQSSSRSSRAPLVAPIIEELPVRKPRVTVGSPSLWSPGRAGTRKSSERPSPRDRSRERSPARPDPDNHPTHKESDTHHTHKESDTHHTHKEPDHPTHTHSHKGGHNSYHRSFEKFKLDNPAYCVQPTAEVLRKKYMRQLDKDHHVYLDYTGGNLIASCQVDAFTKLLKENVLGNPHSINPTSSQSTHLIQKATDDIYDFFNLDPTEYSVIFTQNATGALKLVGESYPFGPNEESIYLISRDNHNSVHGIREFACRKGAKVKYVPLNKDDLSLNEDKLKHYLEKYKYGKNKLFAYPAQSNTTGFKHPHKYIKWAQDLGWDVILDIAAYAPSNPVDFGNGETTPDWASVSFYKIFGWPTGVGCLIARHSKMEKLNRPWFCGGNVIGAATIVPLFIRSDPDAGGFEDGTLNYAALPAVSVGISWMHNIGMATLQHRLQTLTGWMLHFMTHLKHHSGKGVVSVYGSHDVQKRGATICFLITTPEGDFVPIEIVESLASQQQISLRTGCFCNVGPVETALGFAPDTVRDAFAAGLSKKELLQRLSGLIRISFGIYTTFKDIWTFSLFLKKFKDGYGRDIIGENKD